MGCVCRDSSAPLCLSAYVLYSGTVVGTQCVNCFITQPQGRSQGSSLLLKGRSPRAEGCRPGTSPAEAEDAESQASQASPASSLAPVLRKAGLPLPSPTPPQPPSPAGSREPGLPGRTEWGRETVRPKKLGPETPKWGASVVGKGLPGLTLAGEAVSSGHPGALRPFAPASGLQGDRLPSVLPRLCFVGPLPLPLPEPPLSPAPRGRQSRRVRSEAAAHRLGTG
ncbi:SH3 domain-binding protein 1-like [Rhinolophus ferrumequinum]|uniref:SH3 domain-binding protein 1-like n=1 Tax=Rhinolophus ferrumequinum TaxID=59479 RepID=UPI00140F9501|nr:SH3 domain-binding protein 1-like [Rhinolophus ferrumequinum]